jgi:hypothetical protein
VAHYYPPSDGLRLTLLPVPYLYGARHHNYRVILLRDCTIPPGDGEFPDMRDSTNPEGGWMRFVFLRQFETNIGYTATERDFVVGCGTIAR